MAMKPCPNCHAPVRPKYRPFCSLRCQQLDLGRWFTESYRVPVETLDENDLTLWVNDQNENDESR